MKAPRPAGEGGVRQLPPPPSPFLLGRNLRRPLTRRPRVAAAPSVGAERRWKPSRRRRDLGRHLHPAS